MIKDTQGKNTLEKNSNVFENHEYENLGGWYIKWTLYSRSLNEIFDKIK